MVTGKPPSALQARTTGKAPPRARSVRAPRAAAAAEEDEEDYFTSDGESAEEDLIPTPKKTKKPAQAKK